jgi:hypothetical protein
MNLPLNSRKYLEETYNIPLEINAFLTSEEKKILEQNWNQDRMQMTRGR